MGYAGMGWCLGGVKQMKDVDSAPVGNYLRSE